jgi:hypothetical protein
MLGIDWAQLSFATVSALVLLILGLAFFRFLAEQDRRTTRQNEMLNTIISNHLAHLDTTLGELSEAISCLRAHCAGVWAKKEVIEDGEP